MSLYTPATDAQTLAACLAACSEGTEAIQVGHTSDMYVMSRAVSTGQVGRYLPDHFLEHQPLAAHAQYTSRLRLDDLD